MKRLEIGSLPKGDTVSAPSKQRRGNRASRIPEIIEVSIRLLASEGYAGYSINRVASSAGLRLSTVQHYFSSREELLRATMDVMSQRWLERFRESAQQAALPPGKKLDMIVDKFYDNLTEHELGSFIFQSWALAEHEEFAKDILKNIQREYTQFFATIVAGINPSLSTAECSLRASLIAAHADGLLIYYRRAEGDIQNLDELRGATKVIWRALCDAPT